MVTLNPKQRPGFNELNGILSPHRQKIQNLQSFNPNYQIEDPHKIFSRQPKKLIDSTTDIDTTLLLEENYRP